MMAGHPNGVDTQGVRNLPFAMFVGGCVVAGSFTLLPQRLLGQWRWGSLGLI